MKWLHKNFQIILILLAIIYIGSVLLAIYHEGWPTATRTGQIGDSFGGLLAPIINLVTIIFVFNTFEIERKRSYTEGDRIQADSFNSRIERFHKIINEFRYDFYEGHSKTLFGMDAIVKYHSDIQPDLLQGKFKVTRNIEELVVLFLAIDKVISDIKNFKPVNFVYNDDVIFNLRVLYTYKILVIIEHWQMNDFEQFPTLFKMFQKTIIRITNNNNDLVLK